MRGLPALGLPAVPAPPKAKVPSVVGLPREEAVEILVEANFTPAVQIVGSGKPAGTVVSQSPAGGSTVTAGSTVNLSVSNGKDPSTTVPNVVGLKLNQATGALSKAGLGASVSYAATNSKSLDGTVRSQSPNSGAKVDQGATVSLVVYQYDKPKQDGKGGGNDGGGGGPGGGGGGGHGGGGGGGRGA
jgi:eukaryotic-like serine/threonine-protein kinase